MISIALFILILLAIWHLAYEGLLAPSFRLFLRYRLFELRDELRLLRIQQPDNLSHEVFTRVDQGISSQIKYAGLIHFSNLLRMRHAFLCDGDLQQAIAESERLFSECHLQDLHRIRSDSAKATLSIAFVNSGAWAIYILPIFAVICFWKGFHRAIRKIAFAPRSEKILNPAMA